MLSLVKSSKWPVTLLVMLIILGQMGGFGVLQAAATPAPSTIILQQPAALNPAPAPAVGGSLPSALASSGMKYFAKYAGIDGESSDKGHEKWTVIESFKWGATLPLLREGGGGVFPGQAKVDEFELTLFYDKSASKLLEALLNGNVIPMMMVELTMSMGEGQSLTFLKYEFKNVLITRYDVSGVASSGLLPAVQVANNFQEVKVTYTEFDAAGKMKSTVIVQWNALNRG